MDVLLFCTAFIFQFVGHRLGDYFFQTNYQSLQKSKNPLIRLRHCFVYSLTISTLMLISFNWQVALIVFALTILEHFWIDSRKPIVSWKLFLEKRVAKQKDFKIEDLPFFVLIEIDQTVHITRIFLISLLIANGII